MVLCGITFCTKHLFVEKYQPVFVQAMNPDTVLHTWSQTYQEVVQCRNHMKNM
jgi:hypothetical protein